MSFKGRILEGREQLRQESEESTVLWGLPLSEPHIPHLRSQLVLHSAAGEAEPRESQWAGSG